MLTNSLDKDVAEGTAHHRLSKRALEPELRFPPFLKRALVLEVYADPALLTDDELERLDRELGPEPASVLKRAPRDTVIARWTLASGEPTSAPPVVLYPLLSHLRLPIKPGEFVLVAEEDASDSGSVAYWISRAPTVRFADDPCRAHPSREHDASFLPDSSSPGAQPRYSLSNGALTRDGKHVSDTELVPGSPAAIRDALERSVTGKQERLHPVPRFNRRIGDLVAEGSHNALLVVGSERTGRARSSDGSVDSEAVATGAIDAVVGRGAAEQTSPGNVENELGERESNKHAPAEREGDPDFSADAARLYLSAKTDADAALGLGGDEGRAAAAIVKADDVRIVARRSVAVRAIGSAERNGSLVDPDKLSSSRFSLSTDSAELEAPEATLKLERTLDVQADSVKLAGDQHPLPAFDQFASALADFVDALTTALQAGTAGSPVAQQLTGLTALLPIAKQLTAALRSSQSQFFSRRISHG